MKIQSDSTKRSEFVNWLAWLGIAHSGLFLILLLQFGLLAMVVSFDQVQKVFSRTPIASGSLYGLNWMFAHIQFVLCSVFMLALLFFIVCIALLKRKNWARITFIVIMGLGILVCMFPLFAISKPFAGPAPVSARMEDLQVIARELLRVLRVGLIIISALTAFLFAWVIKKLVSSDIRAEFKN